MVSMDGEVEVASYPLHFQPALYVAALMLVQCSIHGCILLYSQEITTKTKEQQLIKAGWPKHWVDISTGASVVQGCHMNMNSTHLWCSICITS